MSARAGDRVSRATDAVTVAGFRVGWSLVRRMPERAAHALFDRIADLTVARGGGARMRANYATVRPELDERALDLLVRDGMRAYLRYYCESFRLPVLTPPDLAARVNSNYDDYRALAERDARNISLLSEELGSRATVIEVPYLTEDVHDLAGLFDVNSFLFDDDQPA